MSKDAKAIETDDLEDLDLFEDDMPSGPTLAGEPERTDAELEAEFGGNTKTADAGFAKILSMTPPPPAARRTRKLPAGSIVAMERSRRKEEFIENDELVQTTKKGDFISVLNKVKGEVAREAAAIRYQRLENDQDGKDTAQLSSRRITALTQIATLELEIKKQGGDFFDLRNERFQRIFNFWIAMLKEVAQETLAPEQMDLFFNKLATALEGWEDKAMEISKS